MNNTFFKKRPCPACGDTHTTEVISSEKLAEDHTYEQLESYWNGFFKEKLFFSYKRCANCNMLYAPVFFNELQLESLYGQMPPNMDEVPLTALKKTQRGYFNTLKKHSNLTGGFIEVGPDIGLFTENCANEGAFSEYWLFEPNRSVENTLEKVVTGKKYHVIHEMFGFSHVPDHSASTAVIIHVLDHLLDPVATLNELRNKLTPDARLLLVTHDESSLLRKIVGWKWPAFCLQHPQIYKPQTMRTLLEKAGFEVIEQSKTVNYFEIRFLLKHLLWAFGFNVKSMPSFGGLSLGLKLGNFITIATPRGK